MKKNKAAVRVLIENRLPGITKDLEGSFAFVTVGTEEGGLEIYLAGDRIEDEKVIARIAYSAAEMVKRLGITKKTGDAVRVQFCGSIWDCDVIQSNEAGDRDVEGRR